MMGVIITILIIIIIIIIIICCITSIIVIIDIMNYLCYINLKQDVLRSRVRWTRPGCGWPDDVL